jgi:hypothetical protein
MPRIEIEAGALLIPLTPEEKSEAESRSPSQTAPASLSKPSIAGYPKSKPDE